MSSSRHASSRLALRDRLAARRAEIEQSVLVRISAVSDPTETGDPAYVEGLRAAVVAALDYGLSGIEHGEAAVHSMPQELLVQARLAARTGVGLDTVLRRYFAGYTLLGDVLIQEARAGPALSRALRDVSREQAILFDRLIAAVTAEYTRELERKARTVKQERFQRIEQLLAGDLLDTSDLAYDFNAWHLGAIAAGPQAEAATRELLGDLDCQTLFVHRGGGTIWLWLGARRMVDPAELLESACHLDSTKLRIAFGEPGKTLSGWRMTHRQAASAFRVAMRIPEKAIRYGDVALLASILRDDLLASFLHRAYLDPLALERDGGETLRQTLRAYFGAERNVSSTAAALKVKRHTVAKRLRAVEEKIGRPIESCSAELEVALQLDQLPQTWSQIDDRAATLARRRAERGWQG